MPLITHPDKIILNYLRLILLGALILCCFVFALSDAVESLHRKNTADSAFLYYESWLINERGVFPYRDIQETSFPGTYLIYSLLGRLGGYSNMDFCISNLVLLVFFSTLTWSLLYRISKVSASIAVLLFIFYYLSEATLSLQRDYLLLIPITAALILCLPEKNEKIRALFVGVLFAFSSLIKPHALIGLPVACWFFISNPNEKVSARFLLCTNTMIIIFGVIFVWAASFFVLYTQDALANFVEMATGYLPLYLHLDGSGKEFEWSGFRPESLFLLLVFPLNEFIPAFIGCVWAFTQTENSKLKKLIISFFILIYLYKIYVFIGAKSWFYHWIPERYFSIIGLSFCLVKPMYFSVKNTLLYMIVVFVFIYGIGTSPIYFFDRFSSKYSIVEKFSGGEGNISDEAGIALSEYIKKNIKSDQTVQTRAQGTYGPIFPTLLELRKIPASTQYPLSAMMYHHIENPHIKRYREKYISDLKNSMPDFIIDDNGFDFFNDKNGESTFKEFDFFLEKNYEKVYQSISVKYPTDSFIVYKRLGNNEQ